MPEQGLTAEHLRLQESLERRKHWKRWGPYLSERAWVRISVKKATCFGFKVATHRSVATLVGLGWVSGFFESSFL